MTEPKKVTLLKHRLVQIGQSAADASNTLALIGLGSAGLENARMDAYSDLDFFLIVEKGYKQHFLSDLKWLSDIAPVAYHFQNTLDGYKLLFADDVFCEFAVFEPEELEQADYSHGRIIWSAASFPESLAAPLKPLPTLITDVEFILGELLTNLYVGLGRYIRGERVSASYFIQHYAVNRLIELIRATEPPTNNSERDPWSVERRFEAHYPHHGQLLHECTNSHLLHCVSAMLGYIKPRYVSNLTSISASKSAIVDKIEAYLVAIQSN